MKKTIILMMSFLVVGTLATCAIVTANQNDKNIIPHSGQYHVDITVEMMMFEKFDPGTVTIFVGDSVEWINRDIYHHGVQSDTGNELGSPSLGPGQNYIHNFTTEGTYDYHCTLHPGIKGKIIVSPASVPEMPVIILPLIGVLFFFTIVWTSPRMFR